MGKELYWYIDCEGFLTSFEKKPPRSLAYCDVHQIYYIYLGCYSISRKDILNIEQSVSERCFGANDSKINLNISTYEEFVYYLVDTLDKEQCKLNEYYGQF